MVEITFSVGEEEFSVEINPESGHPREAYKSGDAVVERITANGYEFIGKAPQYQELSRAHRQSSSPNKIELGDLSDRVKEPPEPAGEVTIELVGPDGESVTRSYESSQTITQVCADIISYHGVDRDRTVKLFSTPSKSNEIEKSKPVADFDESSIYWDISQRR